MQHIIPVCQPTIDATDEAAVLEVMRSRWLSTGEMVRRFETELVSYTGYPYAVALSSCTAALFLALKAQGIGPGAIVGVPALTFTATAAAIEHTGATVQFLDVHPATWLLQQVTSPEGCHAVIAVDLYGQLARGLHAPLLAPVIEDAAHAIGAPGLCRGAPLVCLSFYATKNITTCGEGGALLTRDSAVAERVRMMSLHGLSLGAWARYSTASAVEPNVVTSGYKANMSDIQAAMGLVQLKRLEGWRIARTRIAERYDAELNLPRPPRTSGGIPHLYPVLLPKSRNREEFRERLRLKGVGTGIHYRALTEEPYWRARYRTHCPIAEDIGRRVVSLPLYPHLSQEDQGRVISAVKEAL